VHFLVLRRLGQLVYLLLRPRARCFDAVAALDHVGLEADGSRAAVQLEKETAGVAEDGAGLIATPEGSGARAAVQADGL